jgi:hypothetical protein
MPNLLGRVSQAGCSFPHSRSSIASISNEGVDIDDDLLHDTSTTVALGNRRRTSASACAASLA